MASKVFQKPEGLIPRHDFGIVSLPEDVEPNEMRGKKVPLVAIDTRNVPRVDIYEFDQDALEYKLNSSLQLVDNEIVDQDGDVIYEQKLEEIEEALTVPGDDDVTTSEPEPEAGAAAKPGSITHIDLDQDENY